MSKPDPESLTDEAARLIREEHEQLKALLREMNETQKIEPLVPLLEKLRTLLAEHFEHEEAPDGLASAMEEPRFAGQTEELFEEHRLFLKMLDDLVQQARGCLEKRQDVLRGVAELARQLHEHEGKENALMLDMADTDLGGRG
jgi:hypothetical protein